MKGGGDKIEPTCAELDFGRFLYIHDVEFRFVVPTMTKGKDYDFELIYPDGRSVPADAKCKLESTDIDPTTICNALEKGASSSLSIVPASSFSKSRRRGPTTFPSLRPWLKRGDGSFAIPIGSSRSSFMFPTSKRGMGSSIIGMRTERSPTRRAVSTAGRIGTCLPASRAG